MTDLQPGQINIHGKVYETVALRLKKFWERYPEYSIQTILIQADDTRIIMKATILDDSHKLCATGHAEEFRNRGQINRTSALENCETSAVGRALAFLGLGGTEIRSAEEMQNAVLQQEEMDAELKRKVVAQTLECLDEQDAIGMRNLWDEQLTHEQQIICWREFNSKQKAMIRDLQQKGAVILTEEAEKQAQRDLAQAGREKQ